MEWLKAIEKRCDFSRDLKVAWLAHDRTSWGRLFQRPWQRVGEETEKASEAKSDLTNGITSKTPVEDLNVLTGWRWRRLSVRLSVCPSVVWNVAAAERPLLPRKIPPARKIYSCGGAYIMSEFRVHLSGNCKQNLVDSHWSDVAD